MRILESAIVKSLHIEFSPEEFLELKLVGLLPPDGFPDLWCTAREVGELLDVPELSTGFKAALQKLLESEQPS